MAETRRQETMLVVQDANVIRALSENKNFLAQATNVASKYMTPEKLIKVAMLAAFRQPALYTCSLPSFINSIITAGELGLDFGGITGQGYLIAYGNKNLPKGVKECKFMPGYQGFLELAYRTKQIEYIDSQLVFANDKCEYQLGSDPFIRHSPKLDGDRGPLSFGYGVVILTGSTRPKIEFMTESELMAIKARSRSGDSGPWKTDLHEMCRKTLIRRIWKYIPKTPEVHAALEADNADFDISEPHTFSDTVKDNAEIIEAEMGSQTVEVEEPTTPPETKVPETHDTGTTYTCANCKATSTALPTFPAKDGKFQCKKCLRWTLEPDGDLQDQVDADGESFMQDD